MGVTVEKVEKALQQHPDAKGVFLANPNYYGTASDLKSIVEIAHGYKVPVIVDEAHGAHLPFGDGLPMPALAAGADLAASSTHKMGGSLTQSSMLFLRQGLVSVERVKAVLNLAQTTSPSYLLLSSLDLARKQMALKGRELVRKSLALARWIREELKSIEGIRLFGEGLAGSPGCYAFDPLKVVINVTGLGMSGYEVERLLRGKYNLQVELSDLYNVMFLISLGDNMDNCRYLVDCLKSIAGTKKLGNIIKYCPPPPEIPGMAVLPRDAFYSETRIVPLHEAAGEVSAEAIMAYPPGIPLLCPGEMITQEIIDYVNILKQENAICRARRSGDQSDQSIEKSLSGFWFGDDGRRGLKTDPEPGPKGLTVGLNRGGGEDGLVDAGFPGDSCPAPGLLSFPPAERSGSKGLSF